MIILTWITNKVVVEPAYREINENAYKGISTTRNNVTGELYPRSLTDEIDCLGYGNSYDENQNHHGIYFTFFTEDEMREAVKKSRLLRGKELKFRKEHLKEEIDYANTFCRNGVLGV